nr:MAG TPA: hypothetical protein [Caudoviricetes sp.]
MEGCFLYNTDSSYARSILWSDTLLCWSAYV